MRFAVLQHTLPINSIRTSHWDLLLQFAEYRAKDDKCLDCFELSLPPAQWSSLLISRLPSHRALYLEYVGPISGDRGSVEQVMVGEVQWHSRDKNVTEFDLLADPNRRPEHWPASGQRIKLTHAEKDRWFLQLLAPS